MNKKTITFFMLVTPRDAILADYSIRSFGKLQSVLQAYDWVLQIYLNCLTDNLKKKYVPRWNKLSYVQLLDNANAFDPENINPGEIVHFKGISTRPYEGKYEIGCMVWEREFRKMQSDYWCIVDADFEIIEPDFIIHMLQSLDNDKQLYVYSTDSGTIVEKYNTYANENIISAERYDTWFCMYKKECLQCKSPLYYYEEIRDSKKWVWDDTGKFQEDLKKQAGCNFRSISQIEPLSLRNNYIYQYIHYGAFSKNVTLNTRWKIFWYRNIVILSHRGFILFDRKNPINKITRFFMTKLREYKYGSLRIERGKYQY